MVELQYIQRKNNILFKLVFGFTFPKTKAKINLRPNDFPVFLVEIIEKNEVLRKPTFSVEVSFSPHFLCYYTVRAGKKNCLKNNEDVPREVKTDQHLTTSKRKKRFKSYDLQIIRFPSSNYKKSIRIVILCLEL